MVNAFIIDGLNVAEKLKVQIRQEVESLSQKPGLAVVRVGDDQASQIYVQKKGQDARDVGFWYEEHHLPETSTQSEALERIKSINQDLNVHGLILQLPVPQHLNSFELVEAIDPKKDVDGFHPYNLGRLAQRRPLLRPCTPYGIMKMLDSMGQQYKGKHAVIVGASNIVGRPMALELLMAGSTVTVCHRFTADLGSFVSQGDIVVAAAGRPGLVKGEWIKPGATVIDVAMNRLENGSIIGDVEFIKAKENAAWITPVPGGVGPMTVVMLLQNTLSAAISRDSVLPT